MERRHWSVLTAAALGLAAAGCGVKQAALDQQLSALRAEMHEADSALAEDTQELSSRVDQLDQRVDGLEVMSGRVEDFEVELQSVRRDFDTDIDELQQAIRFNSPVHFEYDSHVIRNADRPLLDRFATIVAAYYPAALITVEGFADPAGDTDYNIWLGEQRANTVRNYLTSMGLAGQRVRVVSYGESGDRQVTPGGWGENGLANRRVSLVIDYSPAAGEVLAGGQ
jgi:peptidoglycan-associated lipoprotein